MSRYDEAWFEEAIGWTAFRAMRDAMRNLPDLLLGTDDVYLSVEIRVRSDSWPGTTESGRSKSTKIGDAACLFRGEKEGGIDERD